MEDTIRTKETTLEGYDTTTGLYFKPPTLSLGADRDTRELIITTDNGTIDLTDEYTQQAEILFRQIQATSGVAETSKMQSSFPCGLHNNQSARCTENDGPMLIYCKLARYGRENTYNKQQIEHTFNTASQHFKTARPADRVNFLRPCLTQALRLRLPLKASQTIIPIHDVLSIRFPWMSTEISQYKDRGNDPEDCAATLDSISVTSKRSPYEWSNLLMQLNYGSTKRSELTTLTDIKTDKAREDTTKETVKAKAKATVMVKAKAKEEVKIPGATLCGTMLT